jgi:ABC-type polar amino acid transport system ATPase subunit
MTMVVVTHEMGFAREVAAACCSWTAAAFSAVLQIFLFGRS